MSKSLDKDHAGHESITTVETKRWYNGTIVSHFLETKCKECKIQFSEDLSGNVSAIEKLTQMQPTSIQLTKLNKNMRHFVVQEFVVNRCGECNKIFKLNENTYKCVFCKIRVHDGDCKDAHNKKLVSEEEE